MGTTPSKALKLKVSTFQIDLNPYGFGKPPGLGSDLQDTVMSPMGAKPLNFPVEIEEVTRVSTQAITSEIVMRIQGTPNLYMEIRIGQDKVGLAVTDSLEYLEKYGIVEKFKQMPTKHILVILRETSTDQMVAFDWAV